MADDFDTLKNATGTASQGLNPNTGGSFHRPSYNSVWKRQTSSDSNNPVYSSNAQQSPSAANPVFVFNNTATESPVRPTGPYNYNPQPHVRIIEQINQPYWESGENNGEDWNQAQSESYQGEDYGTEDASGYSQEEYYNYQKQYKKKGLSFKIDRFVQRFPALSKFYKPSPSSPSSPDRNGLDQRFQYNQSNDLVNSNQLTRELTADELALNPRYSDKTRIKFINLQVKDQTQAVDLSIHHDTNQIYLCDVGRSIVEIYDINGTFEHAINNPGMSKFQPTAIAVAFDETIIIASHFNHCLHMYSTHDSQNTTTRFSYKQFKLGAPGNKAHEFYHPAGIAIDYTDGCVYVCDRGNCRIQVISSDGVCQRMIELVLNDKNKYPLEPVRVAIQQNSDQIVCIIGAGDLICFIPKEATGRVYVDPLFIFDENGLGLEGASGLALDTDNRIFISDTGHHRIVICTPEGGYITSFGTEGDGPGQLKRPCGLDITNDGTVIVTDPGNKRLQLFGLINKQTPVENNPPQENVANTEHEFVDILYL